MWSTSGDAYHIYRLDVPTQTWQDTGTEMDSRSTTKGDAFWDGQKLYYVSHVWTGSGISGQSSSNSGRLFRYGYNSATQSYTKDPGFPVDVNDAKSESLTITKDSTGQLWVTWVANQKVMVNHSLNGDDTSWGTPFQLPVGSDASVSSDDLSSITCFGNKIGVMWSKQTGSKGMYMGVHEDSASDQVWSSGTAYTTSQDDHISMTSISCLSSGSILAAIKTSKSTELVVLLVSDPGSDPTVQSNWSSHPVYRSSQFGPTRPILLIDQENNDAYVFTRNKTGGTNPDIYYKKSSLANINFPTGVGTPFIKSSTYTKLNDPTSTRQVLNGATDLVVLASDRTAKFYFHNYIDLAGGNLPDIAAMPTSKDFGNVGLFSTVSQVFAVKNEGTVDLNVTSTSLAGLNPGEFSINSGGGSFTLAAGATQNIEIGFNPTSTGAKSASLDIDSNDPNENPLIISLSGTGVINEPDIAVTPIPYDYGDQPINFTASFTFTVTNNGFQDLSVSAVGLAGVDTADFSIVSGGAPFVLSSGETRQIVVEFGPTTLGLKSVSLSLTSNDPDEGLVEGALSGTAVPEPTPNIVVTPSPFDYGNVFVTATSAQNFVVRNSGTADLSVSLASVEGLDSGEFGLASGGAPFTLPPGDSNVVEITFNPLTPGAKSALLRIVSNDPDTPQISVDLSGTGEELPLGSGAIAFEESVTGGATGSAQVVSGIIGGAPGSLYLVAVTTRNHVAVTNIAGLGLTWTQVRLQCSGRNATGIEVWMAAGISSGGSVTVNLTQSVTAASIIVTRYSGVDVLSPIGTVVSSNSNGVAGSCSGGTDGAVYSVSMNTTTHGSLVYGAAARRHKLHTSGAEYTERQEVSIGSGGSVAGVAVQDRSTIVATTLDVDGSFGGTVDYAVIGVEIRPGAAPDIAATPSSHDYGDVMIGSSAQQTFKVRNDGTVDLNVSSSVLVGTNAADFTILNGSGAFLLTPGDSHSVDVSFTPTTIGAKTASIDLVSDDPDENPFSVILSGTGIPVPTADIAVTPAPSYDYGNAILGTNISQKFLVSNIGSAALTVSGAGLSGIDTSQFNILRGNAGFLLTPGMDDTVEVSFSPASLGAKSVSLDITSDDPDEAVVSVVLSGTGVPVPVPDIAINPGSHNYGDVIEGTSSEQIFTVHNLGTADLHVSLVNLAGPDSSEFVIISGASGFTVSPADSDTVRVRFAPTAAAAKTTSLQVVSDDPDSSIFEISLLATGIPIPPEPDIAVAPATHTYGDVILGGSLSQVFEVYNEGTLSLNVSGVVLSGTNTGDFGINSGGSAFVLAPGDTHTIDVSFLPLSLGSKSASLQLSSDDPDESLVSVVLSGNGIPVPVPDITVTPMSHNFGDILTGTTVTQNLEIRNDGTLNLNVSASSLTGVDSTEFSILSGGAPFTLTPGDSQTLEVSFTPTTTGIKSAALEFTSDDPDESFLSVSLNGNGIFIPPGGGEVVFEQTVEGGVTNSTTVSTASTISGVAGSHYLAAISFRPNAVVASVSGLGLTWTRVGAQCSGRGVTGIEVWQASGIPSGDDIVSATFTTSISSAVLVVSRYSGVDGSGGLGAIVMGNSNGVSGSCSGGTDSGSYSFAISTTVDGSLVYGAAALRNKRHTAGVNYAERAEIHAGSGGSTSGVAVEDQTVSGAGSLSLAGSFHRDVDWAVIGLVLVPVSDVPNMAVLPNAHDYGGVVVSNSASQSFAVRNDGTVDLHVSASAISGTNAADFSIASGGGAFTLTPGATHALAISFTPSSLGSKTAALEIFSDDPGGLFSVGLSGSGTPPPQPDIAVTPSPHVYGDVIIGTSVLQTFMVGNEGSLDLTVSAVSLAGLDMSHFSITSGGSAFTLIPGGSHAIEVSFTPTSLGTKNATLSLSSDDPDENPLEVKLTGSGIPVPVPDIAVSPDIHDYGDVINGTTVEQTFLVANTGTADLHVASATLSGADSSEFVLSSGAGFVVAPSASDTLRVAFTPSSLAAKTTTLKIFSDDPDSSIFRVLLHGNGIPIPPEPDIAVTPLTHDFGTIALGGTSMQIFSVGNDGGADLHVTATNLSGAASGDYQVTSGGGSFVVTPGTAANIAVSFTPTAAGVRSATLEIVNDDPDGNPASISLSGLGENVGGATLTFNPVADAHVKSSRTTTNYGILDHIRMRSATTIYNSYLKFDVTGLGGVVVSATLRLLVVDGSPDGGSVYLATNFFTGTSTEWQELDITWNNQPDLVGGVLTSAGPVNVGEVVELDITSAISGDGTYTFRMTSSVSNSVKYSSKEGPMLPELVIETAVAPATAVALETAPKLLRLAPAEQLVEEMEVVPNQISLDGNYPNPFNAQTTINYALPEEIDVRLTIYNIAGQEVRRLVDGPQTAGFKNVVWDGKNYSGSEVGSGVYFVGFEAADKKFTRRLLLQK